MTQKIFFSYKRGDKVKLPSGYDAKVKEQRNTKDGIHYKCQILHSRKEVVVSEQDLKSNYKTYKLHEILSNRMVGKFEIVNPNCSPDYDAYKDYKGTTIRTKKMKDSKKLLCALWEKPPSVEMKGNVVSLTGIVINSDWRKI